MDNTSLKISYSAVPASMYLGSGDQSLSPARISDVLNAIVNAPNKYQSVALASAYDGEGATEITYELASALSASGKRVLIIDAEASDSGVYRELRYTIPQSINAALQSSVLNDYTVLNLENTNVFYACFCKNYVEKDAVYEPEKFTAFFEGLKASFDYVLVIAEANTGLSIARSTQISDTTIVVVQSERTRRPVVRQLLDTIKLNGGNVLGLVLNKRPLYIPPFLYKLMYR